MTANRIRQLEYELCEMKTRFGLQQEEIEAEQESMCNKLLRKIQTLELMIKLLQEQNTGLCDLVERAVCAHLALSFLCPSAGPHDPYRRRAGWPSSRAESTCLSIRWK